jgi:hypothetical protein
MNTETQGQNNSITNLLIYVHKYKEFIYNLDLQVTLQRVKIYPTTNLTFAVHL